MPDDLPSDRRARVGLPALWIALMVSVAALGCRGPSYTDPRRESFAPEPSSFPLRDSLGGIGDGMGNSIGEDTAGGLVVPSTPAPERGLERFADMVAADRPPAVAVFPALSPRGDLPGSMIVNGAGEAWMERIARILRERGVASVLSGTELRRELEDSANRGPEFLCRPAQALDLAWRLPVTHVVFGEVVYDRNPIEGRHRLAVDMRCLEVDTRREVAVWRETYRSGIGADFAHSARQRGSWAVCTPPSPASGWGAEHLLRELQILCVAFVEGLAMERPDLGSVPGAGPGYAARALATPTVFPRGTAPDAPGSSGRSVDRLPAAALSEELGRSLLVVLAEHPDLAIDPLLPEETEEDLETLRERADLLAESSLERQRTGYRLRLRLTPVDGRPAYEEAYELADLFTVALDRFAASVPER